MRFRAFYADGRRPTSADTTWAALPPDGLVVAVWWDAAGTRHLECGADALWSDGTEIVSVNLPGTLARAARLEAATGGLKYGVYLQPDLWAAIRAEADDARTPPEA